MRFYVDNSTGQLTPGPGQRGNVATAQNPITITGGTNKLVELQFLDLDTSGEPSVPARKPAGFSIYWLLKDVGDFDEATPLCSIASFTRPSSDAGFYTAFLETNTTGIVTALTTDKASVALAGEINIKDPGADDPDKTDYVYLTVRNWYSQGAEGVPTSGSPAYPSPADLVTLGNLSAIAGTVVNGSYAIPSGQSYATVVFASAFDDDTWKLEGAFVQKLSGTPLNILVGAITAKSASGFTIQLSAETDATGYTLEYNATTLPSAGIGFHASIALADVLAAGANGGGIDQTNLGNLTLALGKRLTFGDNDSTPATASAGSLPANAYGDPSVVMYAPATWVKVTVGIIEYRMPLYLP